MNSIKQQRGLTTATKRRSTVTVQYVGTTNINACINTAVPVLVSEWFISYTTENERSRSNLPIISTIQVSITERHMMFFCLPGTCYIMALLVQQYGVVI